MKHLGISVECRHVPPLDPDFMPLLRFNRAFLAGAKQPVSVAVERADGQMTVCHTFLHGTPDMAAADRYYLNRLVKTLLWMKGGFRVYVSGSEDACTALKASFAPGGEQAFDADFMAHVYERSFEVLLTDRVPEGKDSPKTMGGHLSGCRIGFDAGGSDRKVSAVVDGETVFSEEVVWSPKLNSDPQYHYDGIVAALKSAAAHMPRVGITLDESLSPAEKLKAVQTLMEEGSGAAARVYESIGIYLGHTLALYYALYGCRHVLLFGRVMSGKGGDLILSAAQKVLADEYPELAEKVLPELPDEKFRRVGQSMAAASLPELK